MSTKRPAAYLRKSKDAATRQEHLDRLLTAVREHGNNGDAIVYDDWARSGDQRKLASRKAWREMCAAIERGEHDVVFMNDLDRGGRSLEEWLRFIRVAQDHQVRVIAGETDYSAPENKDRLIFEAWLAERELDAAKRRAAQTIRMRRGRGDVMGQPPYGYLFTKEDGRVVLVEDPAHPIQPILDAMAEAQGNIAEAVRLLNDRGVPSRYGRQWAPPALRRVLRRLRAMPPEVKKARRTRSGEMKLPSPLAKLVQCHCGQLMTPVDSRHELYCRIGSRDGVARHGRYIARQRHVWDALREATGSLSADGTTRLLTSTVAGVRAGLDALRDELRRLGRAYRAGAVDDEEFDAETARLTEEIRDQEDELGAAENLGLESVSRPVLADPGGPSVHWDHLDDDPASVGDELRRVVRTVHLGADMRPHQVELR